MVIESGCQGRIAFRRRIAAARYRDEEWRRRARIRPHSARNLVTIDVGHVDIEQCEVRMPVFVEFDGFPSIVGNPYVETFEFEKYRERTQRRIVVVG